MEESRFSRGEVVSGIVLAGLGVFIIAESRQWTYMAPDGPGAGFFPMWYGIAMVALALLLIGGNLLRKPAAASAQSVDWHAVGRALTAWAALAVCIALLQFLGFVVGFALLSLFVVGVMYRRSWLEALAVAVVGALCFYLVFPLALNVSLPVGVFGF